MVNGRVIEMNVCPMRATFDNVVLEKIVPGQNQDNGLVLPDHVHETIKKRWKVVAAGSKCVEVKLGDYIVFNSPTAGEIDAAGKKYVILPEKDIVAVYKA